MACNHGWLAGRSGAENVTGVRYCSRTRIVWDGGRSPKMPGRDATGAWTGGR